MWYIEWVWFLQIVLLVGNPEWINTVGYTPLLRYSVLASLLSEYVPDGVGISPTTIASHVTKQPHLPQPKLEYADNNTSEGIKSAHNGGLLGGQLIMVGC